MGERKSVRANVFIVCDKTVWNMGERERECVQMCLLFMYINHICAMLCAIIPFTHMCTLSARILSRQYTTSQKNTSAVWPDYSEARTSTVQCRWWWHLTLPSASEDPEDRVQYTQLLPLTRPSCGSPFTSKHKRIENSVTGAAVIIAHPVA